MGIAGAGITGSCNPEGGNWREMWAAAGNSSWLGVLPGVRRAWGRLCVGASRLQPARLCAAAQIRRPDPPPPACPSPPLPAGAAHAQFSDGGCLVNAAADLLCGRGSDSRPQVAGLASTQMLAWLWNALVGQEKVRHRPCRVAGLGAQRQAWP